MKKVQDTRGYERYMALDIHREYILVGAWNAEKDWVLTPRRVSTEKLPEWAKKNIRTGDIVELGTTTNVWATYDITEPLAGRVLVANAAEVEEIAKARVTPALAGGARETDKEDIKKTPEASRRWDRAGSVGPTNGGTGVASLHLLSWTPGQDQCHDPQSSAKPAAQAQSEIVGDRSIGSDLVGSAEGYQFPGEDADPTGAGTAAGS
jgi:hypothetical protein